MIRRTLAVLAALTAASALLAFPADAGERGNTLNVTKVVEGDVPAGTQFTINVSCTDGFNYDFEDDFVYPETGGTQSVPGIPGESSCRVAETDDGGADSVSYACSFSNQGNFDSCDADDQGASYGGSTADSTITVTNTFAEDVDPDDVDPTDTDTGDVGVVTGSPSFTG